MSNIDQSCPLCMQMRPSTGDPNELNTVSLTVSEEQAYFVKILPLLTLKERHKFKNHLIEFSYRGFMCGFSMWMFAVELRPTL